MKKRTIQRLSCAAAIVAATAVSCGNFTNRSPVVEPLTSTMALKGSKRVLDFNPIGSSLTRPKKRARVFVFAGSGRDPIYRTAREELLSGPFSNIKIDADVEVTASLELEKRQILITATRSGASEQCAVSTKGMGNVSIMAASGPYGLKFYAVEIVGQNLLVGGGGHFKAREIEVSFSTVVTVSSAGIGQDGQGRKSARIEGMKVVHRDVLIPNRTIGR